MSTSTPPVDPALRRRCRQALADHRRRAARDFQALDYALADLEDLVRRSPCCCYCGCPLSPATFALDHATPTARGGRHALGNLLVCCEVDNQRKGILTADEYRALWRLLSTWHPRAGADVLRRLRAGGRRYATGRGRGGCGA
jgi:5-methylcytosine-specific restriction endonuclease McrA